MESIVVVAVLGIGALIYLFAVHGKPPLPNENDPIEPDGPAPKLPTARVHKDDDK
jgi:hypothetical protein